MELQIIKVSIIYCYYYYQIAILSTEISAVSKEDPNPNHFYLLMAIYLCFFNEKGKDIKKKIKLQTNSIEYKIFHAIKLFALDFNDKGIISELDFILNFLKWIPQLKSLSLARNNLKDEPFIRICDSFDSLQSIVELDLSDNLMTDTDYTYLSKKMKCFLKLQKLTLKNNYIDDICIQCISQGFQYCDKLKELNLGKNKITGSGIESIVSEFQYLTSLVDLILFDNLLSDSGVSALMEGMSSLFRLSTLDVSCIII